MRKEDMQDKQETFPPRLDELRPGQATTAVRANPVPRGTASLTTASDEPISNPKGRTMFGTSLCCFSRRFLLLSFLYLLAVPSGGWSQTTGYAPADQAAFDALVVGKRAYWGPGNVTEFVSPGRFIETDSGDTYSGSYTYRRTGPNTGTLVSNYGAGQTCTNRITFTTATSGRASYTCSDGERAGPFDWRLSGGSAAPDLLPSFGDARLAPLSYLVGTAVSSVVLPAATGGDGPLRYALTPALPPGLRFTAPADATTGGTLSGTPTAPRAVTTYTLTATDADGDAATLPFTLAIIERERGALRATLLNLSPWQAWVHLYCLKDRGPDAAPCAVTFECNGQSGEPVAWPVEVGPKTIFSYWPNKIAPDGTAADLQAALIAAGKPEDEARRRTTCEVFSPDLLTVRGYTLFGGQPTLVPVAEPARPDVAAAPGERRRQATLPNLSPWQAWVHLYCLKDRAGPDADPPAACAVTFECNGQSGDPVTWPVTVAAKTIFSYWPNKTVDGLSADLQAALMAAGKPADEARRRTTCEVSSADPIAARGYTRFGGQPTLVPVTAY